MALIKSCLASASVVSNPDRLVFGIQSGSKKAGYYVNNGTSTDFINNFPSDMGWCTYDGANDITIVTAGRYRVKVNAVASDGTQSSQSDTTQDYAASATINYSNLVTYGSTGLVEITRVS